MIYLYDLGFSVLTLTLIFAAYIVTIIPAMLILGPLADAVGRHVILLIAAIVGGCGVRLTFVTSLSFINQLISQEERGDVFGTFYALIYTWFGETALAVGLLTGPIGPTAAVAVVVVALCLVVVVGGDLPATYYIQIIQCIARWRHNIKWRKGQDTL